MERFRSFTSKGKSALGRMASNASMRFGKVEKHEHDTGFDAKKDEFTRFYTMSKEFLKQCSKIDTKHYFAIMPSGWTLECIANFYFDEGKQDELSQNVKEKTDFLRKFSTSGVQQALENLRSAQNEFQLYVQQLSNIKKKIKQREHFLLKYNKSQTKLEKLQKEQNIEPTKITEAENKANSHKQAYENYHADLEDELSLVLQNKYRDFSQFQNKIIALNIDLFSQLQQIIEPIYEEVNSEEHAAKVSFKSNVHSKETEVL